MLGDDACSTKTANIWLARCDQFMTVDAPAFIKVNSNAIIGSAVKISDIDDEIQHSPDEKLTEVLKVTNPCAELRKEREDRRFSQRLQ